MDVRALADEDLVPLMARGAARAFEAIYERHGGAAYALAYRLAGRRSAAHAGTRGAYHDPWLRRARGLRGAPGELPGLPGGGGGAERRRRGAARRRAADAPAAGAEVAHHGRGGARGGAAGRRARAGAAPARAPAVVVRAPHARGG